MTVPSGSVCSQCGATIGPEAYFCPRCGTGIPTAEAARATMATPAGRPHEAGSNAQLEALRQATLGEYEILAELGRGGMATVYLAHDLALDRKVAIKVLAPALLLMGEGMVERFKREARTAAALSHPHIIPIYAVKESQDVLYFVMKYVRGRALDAVIRDVGPLPLPMVQAILAQVSDALGYAHRHGVIHRDVKSANIMLDEDGWAVVTDFGIAKVVQAEGLTLTGVTVGTPTYMSPEQCDMREVTGASDQYSLGVVAYEMLTGHLPFKGDSTMSVMYAHFNQPPRPVTELRPDCPPNLGAGVMRMLEKEPSRRWPSMDDVVAVCGRPSLRHDDPVRREMITLAKAGASAASARGRAPGHAGAHAAGQGARGDESRARGGCHAGRPGAGRQCVQGGGIARRAGPGIRRDGAARHRRVALGRGGALVALPAAGRDPARGCAAGGASPGRSAGRDQGIDRGLRPGARVARPGRDSPRVSGPDVRGAGDVQPVLRVGDRPQGRPDHQPADHRGRLGRRVRERRVRVPRHQDRPQPAGHDLVPRDPAAGFDWLASHRDPLGALGWAQKLYSRPAVQSALGRSPPWFSGHSVLATSVIPEPVRNLNPSEPLIWSSRSFGRFVTLIVRRNGASYVTGPGSLSLLSPTCSCDTTSTAMVAQGAIRRSKPTVA